ncbi:hypothetical protein F5050DRAFT_1714948 [Lentinula boryana]|uniref:Uncharacterized protein n=1 Tax=Lentinula boryana TaxID=40481 RepID=A0ABQ8Q2Z1_9AGAR|nr:hypothetical protein F5050DRAFT_1714948 [Lentinula boryana]
MITTTLLSALLLLPAILINAASVADLTSTKGTYPELIPGAGLPTLAELNLTSEALYTMTPKLFNRELVELSERSELFTNECFTYTTANVNDVIACFNYLENIGGNTCSVNGDNVQFCYAGTAQISGSNVSGTSSAASLCSDVALGVQWIFTNCNVGGLVGGAAAANGNGFLIVGVENIDW